MLNVFVSKIRLQRPGIVTTVGKRVAAGMPQHVRMRLEAKLRLGPSSFEHSGEARGGERCSALRGEHKRRLGVLLALEPPQGLQFITDDRVSARGALLDPADVQGGRSEVDLIPAKVPSVRSP